MVSHKDTIIIIIVIHVVELKHDVVVYELVRCSKHYNGCHFV